MAKSPGLLSVASLIFLQTLFIIYFYKHRVIEDGLVAGGTSATLPSATVHTHGGARYAHVSMHAHARNPVLKCDPRGLGVLKPSVFPNEFWFVKTMKVGGTTLQSILNTICGRYNVVYMGVPATDFLGWNNSWGFRTISEYRALPGFRHVAITDHGNFDPALAEQLRNPLLFTALRDPVDRAISHIYFFFRPGTGRKDLLTPTIEAIDSSLPFPGKLVESIVKVFQEEALHDHLFRYIQGNKETPEEVVAQYDFIFIQERFLESLVVFAIDYGLSLIDVAHLSTKVRTGKYPTQEALPTQLIQRLSEMTKKDREIYDLALARLDKRIEEIRRDSYKKGTLDNSPTADYDGMLENLGRLQAAIETECADFPAWHEANGFSSGYFTSVVNENDADPGIGQRCLDYVSRKWLLSSL